MKPCEHPCSFMISLDNTVQLIPLQPKWPSCRKTLQIGLKLSKVSTFKELETKNESYIKVI